MGPISENFIHSVEPPLPYLILQSGQYSYKGFLSTYKSSLKTFETTECHVYLSLTLVTSFILHLIIWQLLFLYVLQPNQIKTDIAANNTRLLYYQI